ncbi:glycosyltransferase family 1 protein [Flavivirga aquimarina]|uniref:Glycosyltransferase family 1 protein n=1 Tax=Flavivirga aquimarina TaxID=2027862 RepID=A0ABT8W8U9_9FLAO|nr:glycosyltransferase family 1 protein [Flavivirga aquimarina]MDO5969487.1 glycosyltransferase family 1 protein [Flavivirga aquimarina]
MEIFVDGYTLHKENQGTKTFILELYRQLLETHSNIKITLGIRKEAELSISEYFGEKTDLYIYKLPSRMLVLNLEIPYIIAKKKIELAHFQYWIPWLKLNSCKYLVTIHDVLFLSYKKEFPKSYYYSRKIIFKINGLLADITSTVSNYSRLEIRNKLNIKKDIYVIRNGVSDLFIKAHNLRPVSKNKYDLEIPEKYILCVSRIEPRKNHHLMIQLFLELELQKKGVHIIFIGHKSLKYNNLDQMLQGVSMEQKQFIHFISNVELNDLLFFYKQASLFLYLSKAEGFGIPPIEAGAIGVPVVCAKNTAMVDFEFFGEDLVSLDNIETLKQRILFNLDNQNQNQLLLIKNEILKKYTWKNSVNDLEVILSDYFPNYVNKNA